MIGDPPEGLVVTKFRRDEGETFYRARVSLNGSTVDVDDRRGSWQADVPNGRRGRRDRRFVLPAVAAVLARRRRKLEKREPSR